MKKIQLIRAATLLIAIAAAGSSVAKDTLKIGLVLPMTGHYGPSGQQVMAGAQLYMAQHGDTINGKKVELIVKDDTAMPEIAKRLAQELVVNEKVDVLAGFGLTPLAFSAAPIATRSKTPMVVMVAATSKVIDASPYIVRTSWTMPQVTMGVAKWAPKNGIKKVMTLVADYGPGLDTEAAFKKYFTAAGGEVVEALRVPMNNPDFGPALKRVRDQHPDALFVFVAESAGMAVMKEFTARELGKAGIKLIGTGDMVGDDVLNRMGDVALGIVTSHHYSAAHPTELNKEFVKAYAKANSGSRPNFMSISGYDGMHVIYEAFKKTNGEGDGDALLAAMKGQHFLSPRGPVTIDPETRDIIQNVYVRKVEKINGEFYNVEFDVMEAVKNPVEDK